MMLKGKPPRFRNGKCSNCGVNDRRQGGRLCRDCHATYERQRRAALREELERLRNHSKQTA